ncbi:MAG: LexA family transcriptional regulator [Candidatus Pacebacteria bacterium]|nr:LexA family transcriptional regulator [Candidatus Paceibacterota bacterium]
MEDSRLNKVRDFYKNHHRLPSYSEMLRLFKLASKNAIYKIVKKWQETGLVEKINHKLAPTKDFFRLPFFGLVKAGFPTGADEDHRFLSLEDYLIDKPQASFLLTVDGDSLSGIGILPGDLAIIEKRTEARTEEIVLALIDNHWSLKILRRQNGRLRLESANEKYPPLYPKEDLQIFGVLKGVIRKIK